MNKRIEILVVDDEKSIARGLKLMIDSFAVPDVDCRFVTTVDDALALIDSERIDIVITDISMPVRTGLDLLAELADKDIKTVVVSGYDSFEYVKTAFKLGLSDYLLKPVDKQLLRALLLRLIAVCRLDDFAAARADAAFMGVGRVALFLSGTDAETLYLDILRDETPAKECVFFERGDLLGLFAPEAEACCLAAAVVEKRTASGKPTAAVLGLPATCERAESSLAAADSHAFAFLKQSGRVITAESVEAAKTALAGKLIAAPTDWVDRLAAVELRLDELARSGRATAAIVESDARLSSDPMALLKEEPIADTAPDELRRIDELIEKHIFNKPDMAMISNLLNWNYYYFSKKFARLAGCSFSSYLEDKKLEKAGELLRTEDIRVYALAQKLGYASVRYFVRLFRKKYGLSPKEYREREKSQNFDT